MVRLNIDHDYLTDILREMLETPSPTGFTDTIVRLVSKELINLGLEVELTRRGAIRAIRKGQRSDGARAIVTHLDTLGAQVKYIKDLSLIHI
jgi:putative aminopeptidase FrvX